MLRWVRKQRKRESTGIVGNFLAFTGSLLLRLRQALWLDSAIVMCDCVTVHFASAWQGIRWTARFRELAYWRCFDNGLRQSDASAEVVYPVEQGGMYR